MLGDLMDELDDVFVQPVTRHIVKFDPHMVNWSSSSSSGRGRHFLLSPCCLSGALLATER